MTDEQDEIAKIMSEIQELHHDLVSGNSDAPTGEPGLFGDASAAPAPAQAQSAEPQVVPPAAESPVAANPVAPAPAAPVAPESASGPLLMAGPDEVDVEALARELAQEAASELLATSEETSAAPAETAAPVSEVAPVPAAQGAAAPEAPVAAGNPAGNPMDQIDVEALAAEIINGADAGKVGASMSDQQLAQLDDLITEAHSGNTAAPEAAIPAAQPAPLAAVPAAALEVPSSTDTPMEDVLAALPVDPCEMGTIGGVGPAIGGGKPMSDSDDANRPQGGDGTLSLKLTGRMTLKLQYDFEGQEVSVHFGDGMMHVSLADGTEFKIPVGKPRTTLKRVA